jgi:hypothetical protein
MIIMKPHHPDRSTHRSNKAPHLVAFHGAITVAFMDPEAVLTLVDKPEMTVIGKEVRALLQRVCASLKA